ncbi:MAG TPA: nucleotidyltransferase family protein [Candidatus Binatia bacterium]|nr:nucleotidyltransferase family protein [Candidatus Binatia bacterium]
MPKIKTAMLLAAGYGTRLKPLTDHTPKPLVPVAGRPMIEYALDKLREYGIERVVINVSHLKEQLVDYLAAQQAGAPASGTARTDSSSKRAGPVPGAPTALPFPSVQISEEPEPLETGGGLKKAAPFLGNEPVFVINSDILWSDSSETALNRLTQHWDDAKMDFLLLAQSKAKAVGHDKGEDHLFIKPDNTIGWNEADAPYIISGIGIFHPRVLRDAPDGKFSVKVLWLRAMEQNRLFCLPHHGRWFQTGTIEDIRKTEEELKDIKLSA